MTDKTPKWSSIAAQGIANPKNFPKKEKDDLIATTTSEAVSSENPDIKAESQQEKIGKGNAAPKNIPVANAKNDNDVPEKMDGEVLKPEQPTTPKQDGNAKQNRSNNGNNSGHRFRKGRNHNEENRNYSNRPSGNATVFDHIRPKMANPPPESPIKHDNVNRRNNGGNRNNDNRDGCINAQQSGSHHDASDEFAQMKISDAQDPPLGNNYRGQQQRGRGGGRGKTFYNHYNTGFHIPPPPLGHAPYAAFAPPHPGLLSLPPPPPGYVLPMPQHIRNVNQTGVEVGKSVLAPFTDNNYYLGVVIGTDEVNGLSLVQYNHCPLPHFIHTEYLQLCHV